jgi:hypothetical protein
MWLALTHGYFVAFQNTTQGIRLLMHWNDGAMACSTGSDGVEACHGFLQVCFMSD